MIIVQTHLFHGMYKENLWEGFKGRAETQKTRHPAEHRILASAYKYNKHYPHRKYAVEY